MKLFIKDHLDIIGLYLFNMVFLVIIYQFIDGFNQLGRLFYFILITIFLLVCLLTSRYLRKKKIYQQLSSETTTFEEISRQSLSYDSLVNSFNEFNHNNYLSYLKEINQVKERTTQWQLYTIQWAHQMKTPISIIRLMAQDNSEPIDRFKLLYELDKIENQLNLVLNLARLDKFSKDIHIEVISLNQLVQNTINQNQRLFIQHQVYPKFTSTYNLMVYTDKKWMEFVLQQLIHNAVKFSSSNSKITFLITENDEMVNLIVKDEGIGIPSEDLPRVFDIYFTGKNGRQNQQSSGIGLYLVHGILTELGHSIRIHSKVNQGTEVSIIFPIEK